MGRYGFHFTGVTASGVPLLELTQPASVIAAERQTRTQQTQAKWPS
jgi:hypothetical protein